MLFHSYKKYIPNMKKLYINYLTSNVYSIDHIKSIYKYISNHIMCNYQKIKLDGIVRTPPKIYDELINKRWYTMYYYDFCELADDIENRDLMYVGISYMLAEIKKICEQALADNMKNIEFSFYGSKYSNLIFTMNINNCKNEVTFINKFAIIDYNKLELAVNKSGYILIYVNDLIKNKQEYIDKIENLRINIC